METRKSIDLQKEFKLNEEKCSKCQSRAEYICVCRERKVCDNCLIKHVGGSKDLSHRPVSMKHPLLTLILSEADEVFSESGEASDQVEKLQLFKERSIAMVDKKIKQLIEQQDKSTHRKSVNKTSDTLKISEVSMSRASPGIDLGSISKSPPLKKEDLSCSPMALSARSFSRPTELKYKIILAGDPGVGKSTLLQTFRSCQKQASPSQCSSKVTGSLKLDGMTFHVDLWDLSGKDKYLSLSKMCVSGAAAAIILFDLRNELSLWSIDKRSQALKEEADVLSVLALVGNKIDLTVKCPKRRFISFDRGQEIAASKGMIYDEISACNELHVVELFKRVVKEVWSRKIMNKSNNISLV